MVYNCCKFPCKHDSTPPPLLGQTEDTQDRSGTRHGGVYAGMPAKLTKTRVIREDLYVLSQKESYYITQLL